VHLSQFSEIQVEIGFLGSKKKMTNPPYVGITLHHQSYTRANALIHFWPFVKQLNDEMAE
jgi:hypothetical protein